MGSDSQTEIKIKLNGEIGQQLESILCNFSIKTKYKI